MRSIREGTRARPEIVIGAADEDRLARLANGLVGSKPDLAEELLGELARARLVDDGAVPATTVRMGSTLTYEAGGRTRRVSLVYPPDADIAAGPVSILPPIGTALIGRSEGQSIDWTARDGSSHRLTVLAVEPPAAG
jgi:regulator of nucleoside diphosphate kinase